MKQPSNACYGETPILDWVLSQAEACAVFDWALSQDEIIIIAQLKANYKLWHAIREQVIRNAQILVDQARIDMQEACATIVDTHAIDCERHEGYCYASELRDIAAKIRARGGE